MDMDIRTSTCRNNLRVDRNASYAVAVLTMASAGTMYAFGTYEDSLKEALGFTQSQISTVGYMGDAGLYLSGPFTGRLVDRMGPRVANTVAACNLLVGYLMMCAAVHAQINSSVFVGTFFAMAGAGSGGLYLSLLSSQARNFSAANRGMVVGILVSLYGLSAMLYTMIYSVAFSDRMVVWFLAFIGASTTLTALLSAACTYDVNFLMSTQYTTTGFAHLEEDRDGGSPAAGPADEASEEQQLIGRSQSKGGWGAALVVLAQDVRFWLAFSVLFLLSGSGLMFINNIGSMSKAIRSEGQSSHKETVAMLFSLMNCLGRVGTGVTSDRLPIRKGWFLVVQGLLMLVMYALMIIKPCTVSLLVSAVGVGVAYGGLWAIQPTLVSEIFGIENFGTNWGYMVAAPGLGGFVFNFVTGMMYDQVSRENELHATHIDKGEADMGTQHHQCRGEMCYKSAFVFSVASCVLAVVLALCLVPETNLGKEAQTVAVHSVEMGTQMSDDDAIDVPPEGFPK
mmetsp:Transcript_7201/g.13657  ORF Transcript_7201/g.13657 Transcript_7201/m.13657 type:complete len:509 (+) Transcript_7201:69-1595(+)